MRENMGKTVEKREKPFGHEIDLHLSLPQMKGELLEKEVRKYIP